MTTKIGEIGKIIKIQNKILPYFLSKHSNLK